MLMLMTMMTYRERRESYYLLHVQPLARHHRASRRRCGATLLALSTACRHRHQLGPEAETVFGRADGGTGTGSDVIGVVAAVAVGNERVQQLVADDQERRKRRRSERPRYQLIPTSHISFAIVRHSA